MALRGCVGLTLLGGLRSLSGWLLRQSAYLFVWASRMWCSPSTGMGWILLRGGFLVARNPVSQSASSPRLCTGPTLNFWVPVRRAALLIKNEKKRVVSFLTFLTFFGLCSKGGAVTLARRAWRLLLLGKWNRSFLSSVSFFFPDGSVYFLFRHCFAF